MKILHIIYDSPNNKWMGGGGALRVNEIYKRFSKKENILIISGRFSYIKEEKINGVNYRYLGFYNNYLISRLTFILFSFFYIIFNHKKYDLIIEELGPCPLFLPIYIKNTPIIGSIQVILKQEFKKEIVYKILWFLQKLAFGIYKNKMTVSDYTERVIKKEISNKEKVVVIYPGIEKIKIGYNNNKKEKYILYLGRLDYVEKGIDLLLEAINFIKNDLEKKIKFYLVGNGKKDNLKKIKDYINLYKLKNRIKILGYKCGKEKYRLIKNSLFLCLPSRNENFPLVVLEAFYFKKTIICSNVGGLKEIISKSRACLTYNKENVIDLAHKIKSLVNNKFLRIQLGKKGKLWIKNLTWEKCAEKTFKFYYSILKQRNKNVLQK